MADQSTGAPRPPKGRSADDRLIRAIVELNDQFAICGLQQPVAIMVAPGQAKWIQAMLANSPNLLFDDKRCGDLRVWGIPIREEAQDV